jgi:hypothetical protein
MARFLGSIVVLATWTLFFTLHGEAQQPRPMPGAAAGAAAPAEPKRACPTIRDYATFYKCAIERIKVFKTTSRTSDGKPNLNGLWSATRIAQDIEEVRAGQYGAGGAMKSLIVDPADGKIPYQPWAQQPRRDGEKKWVSPTALCLPVGAVRWSYSPVSVTGHRIIQQPREIIFSMERLHTYRIIPLDNRRRLDSHVKLWQGESRGHWEGETLVINTTNLTDKVWFDHIGTFMSNEITMEERITYVDPDTLLYVATYTDPKVFTQPWKIAKALLRAPAKGMDAVDLEDTTIEGCDETIEHMFGAGQRPFTGLDLVLPK